jgi:tRNA (guanine-N7-)-methyltransferase
MSRSRPAIDVSRHLIDPGRQSEAQPPFPWTDVFGDLKPIELEIGSGKGLFLRNAAKSEPGVNFLGIELSRKYARGAAERLAREELINAKIWCGDARYVLSRVVPAESLRAVHVYFPDPWWKTRHKKRRVFSSQLVQEIERTLVSGGLLNVASDVLEYFEVISGLINSCGRFCEQELPIKADPANPLDYLTHFERKYRLEGRRIFQARYVLQANPDTGAVEGVEGATG